VHGAGTFASGAVSLISSHLFKTYFCILKNTFAGGQIIQQVVMAMMVLVLHETGDCCDLESVRQKKEKIKRHIPDQKKNMECILSEKMRVRKQYRRFVGRCTGFSGRKDMYCAS